MSPAAGTSRSAGPADLVALHGDSWESPWFLVAIAGAAPDLTRWNIHAEARTSSDDGTPLFSWTVPHGVSTDTGVELGTGRARLLNGDELDLPAIQLRLRARDWAGKPARWSGFLEIELTRGPAGDPDERRTIVRRRPFRIVPDLVP